MAHLFLNTRSNSVGIKPTDVICASSVSERKINPKRLQRLARKSIQYGVGTKAQQTLQKQLECQKVTRQHNRRTKKILDQDK
jgi:hypothetical protein